MEKFVVIGLPDTQKYSESYPETFIAQTQAIVENRDRLNIQFVSHYGDVVEHGTNELAPLEFERAVAAMDLLRVNNIPHHITEGNHDSLPFGVHLPGIWDYDNTHFLENFGPQWYDGFDWFGGASPSGLSNYQVFEGGGETFLAMSLSLETPFAELAWAQEVLNANPDKPVMLTTHRYLQDAEDYELLDPVYAFTRTYESGRIPDLWYTLTPEILYNPSGIYANDLFEHFIAANRNIFLVNSGHDAEQYHQTSINHAGLPVHEVLADFSGDFPNGGNGYLRAMQFDTALNRIDVYSYSPTTNSFLTAPESQFSLTVDFDQYQTTNARAYFQEGIGGYASTQDTWINQAAVNANYGSNAVITVDDDTTNSLINDRRGQGLLRFDQILGDPLLGQIPLGATIVEANLRIALANDIDNPLYNPSFRVHLMTRAWDETSTWSSLAGGLTQGSDYGDLLATFIGDNNPNGAEGRVLDVTNAVQRWANGEPNYGFAILPEVINGNDDGIDLFSSESSAILFRPVLEVEYFIAGSTALQDRLIFAAGRAMGAGSGVGDRLKTARALDDILGDRPQHFLFQGPLDFNTVTEMTLG